MPGARSLRGRGIECKGHEETFLGDGNVVDLDCGGGYRGVCFHQN